MGALAFDLGRVPRLIEVLDALGYGRLDPPPHARLAAEGEGIRVTVYDSGKLLLQGKRAAEVEAELAAFGLIAGSTAALEKAARSGDGDGAKAPARRADRKPGAAAPAREAAGEARAAGAAGSPAVEAAGDPPGAAPASPASRFDAATAVIGSDEAGKGDYFGRLVVAACAVDAATEQDLRALGVDDSKKLSDRRVAELARHIRQRCPHELVSISPRRYNELYASFQNVNTMLAWAHGRALEALCEREPAIRRAVLDQFAANPRVVERALGERGRALELRQRTRAEEETPVAAASILARDGFVTTLADLGRRFDMELPKGAAAHVDEAGRRFVARHGREALAEVAKLHFRTTERVLR